MKKLTDLTSEEKRVLCAEACLIKCADYGDEKFFHSGDPLRQMMWPDSSQHKQLPHYDTSLDAMATAIETLQWNEIDAYLDALARIVDLQHGYRMELTLGVVNATAAQRLDAFLIAKGLAK